MQPFKPQPLMLRAQSPETVIGDFLRGPRDLGPEARLLWREMMGFLEVLGCR